MKKLKRVLIRNLILALLPYFVFVLILLVTAGRLEKMDSYKVYEAKNYEDAIKQYFDDHINFRIPVKDVNYAGFDYVIDNKTVGGYYYHYDGKNIRILLLDNETYAEIKKGKGTAVECNLSVVYDESAANYFIKEFSDGLGVPSEDIEKMSTTYVFSSIDYPGKKILTVYIVQIIALIAILMMLVYILIASFVPDINYMTRRLQDMTADRDILKKLRKELNNNIVYENRNVIVTYKYLVVMFVDKVDVVRLDDIEYMSKHEETIRRLGGGRERKYRLSVSNADNLFYECLFEDEDIIDEVILNIKGETEKTKE